MVGSVFRARAWADLPQDARLELRAHQTAHWQSRSSARLAIRSADAESITVLPGRSHFQGPGRDREARARSGQGRSRCSRGYSPSSISSSTDTAHCLASECVRIYPARLTYTARLYHAHFMLIHFFILLGINALSPFAPRLIPQVCSGSSKIDGAVCATSIAIFDAATAIRAFTVFASISAHIGYELYARAAEQRWSQSDRLGKRAAETCKRELPWCLIGASWLAQCRLTHSDAVAIPVGFVYSGACSR